MASSFDEQLAALDGAVNDQHGEAALIRPRETVAYHPSLADPDRPEETVEGVYSNGPQSGPFTGAADWGGAPMLDKVIGEFWLSAVSYASIGYEVKEKDELILTDRQGQPSFMITDIHRSSEGDVNLILAEIPDQ